MGKRTEGQLPREKEVKEGVEGEAGRDTTQPAHDERSDRNIRQSQKPLQVYFPKGTHLRRDSRSELRMLASIGWCDLIDPWGGRKLKKGGRMREGVRMAKQD